MLVYCITFYSVIAFRFFCICSVSTTSCNTVSSAIGAQTLAEDATLSLDVNSNFGMIFPTDYSEKLKERGEERSIDLFFAVRRKESFDQKDINEKPLFERALKNLGPLEADEMYAFVPALALGGVNKLENLQKVKNLVLEACSYLLTQTFMQLSKAEPTGPRIAQRAASSMHVSGKRTGGC